MTRHRTLRFKSRNLQESASYSLVLRGLTAASAVKSRIFRNQTLEPFRSYKLSRGGVLLAMLVAQHQDASDAAAVCEGHCRWVLLQYFPLLMMLGMYVQQ